MRPERATLRLSWVTAFIVVLSFAMGVLAHYHDRFWYPPDEGAHAYVAELVLNGAVLHRDMQEIHAGYVNFVNAFAFYVFGIDLISLRYPLVVITLLQSCLIFFLLVPRGRSAAIAGAVAMIALTMVQYINPNVNWYCLFLTILIIGILAWIPVSSRWRLETVGFLIVTIFLFRQLTGVFVAAGVLTYLLSETGHEIGEKRTGLARIVLAISGCGLLWYLVTRVHPFGSLLLGAWPLGVSLWALIRSPASDRKTVRIIGHLSIGGMLAALPLVIYHLSNHSLPDWFDDTFLGALALSDLSYRKAESYAKLILFSLQGAAGLDNLASVLNGLFWIALTLIGPILGYRLVRNLFVSGRDSPAMHPLPIMAVYYGLVSLDLQIPIYLTYTSALSMAGLLWLTSTTSRRVRLPAFVIFALSAIGLYYQAAQPVARGYFGIVSGERVELVRSGLNRASLWITEEEARAYSHVTDLIRRIVDPGEAILAIPQNPEIYFLAERRNPFQFFNSALGIRNQAELESVLNVLETTPPKLVLYWPGDKYNTAYSKEIMNHVRARYEHLQTEYGFEIYRYSVE